MRALFLVFLLAITVNFPALSDGHNDAMPQKVIDPDKAYRVAVEAVRDKKYTIAVEHFEILAKQSQYDGLKTQVAGVAGMVSESIIGQWQRVIQMVRANIHHNQCDGPVAFTDWIQFKSPV